MKKIFAPMVIQPFEDSEINYPVYLQRYLYGVRSFFKRDKFYFEKDLKVRSGEFLKMFEPTDLEGLPGIIDGYFIYGSGIEPESEVMVKNILQNPGLSAEGLTFVSYDLFIPDLQTSPYKERLRILTDYCSKTRNSKHTSTMSATAKSSKDLLKYKDLFFSKSIKGVFIRPDTSIYCPSEVSNEVFYLLGESNVKHEKGRCSTCTC